MASTLSTSQFYCGRFAPSPTGPLHFGSLVAAVASYLQARSQKGLWRVRIEDLDPPREVPGAAGDILRTLTAFGMRWDGEAVYQSRRLQAYAAALQQLLAEGWAYPCACSRREIADSSLEGPAGPVYPGTCRSGPPAGRSARALRVRVDGAMIRFDDAVQGAIQQNLAAEVGDYVVRRADGWCAYQLAVVVDDAAQGITEVVRGADLLDSTPRQIHLQGLLQLPTPRYLHVPVAVNARGEKLSKQTGAPPLRPERPVPTLWAVLHFLGQQPPPELRNADLDGFWRWALAHWNPAHLPRRRTLGMDAAGDDFGYDDDRCG